ncbi:MAG: sulfotransferase [Pseudomonadales bacterium]
MPTRRVDPCQPDREDPTSPGLDGKPNLIVIGAHRAGTTAVYRFCQEHPQVYMSPIKETNFLAFDPDNPAHLRDHEQYPVRTLEEYRDQFRGVSAEPVVGEASPNYLYSQLAVERIAKHLPEAGLLLMLRNPIDRLRSMYLAQVRDGRTRRSWQQAISSVPWLKRHAYCDNVARYVHAFGRQRLIVMFYEDLEADANAFCSDLFGRLRVDPTFVPNLQIRHNKGGVPRSKLLHRLTTNKRVNTIAGSLVPHSWINAAKSVRNKNLDRPPPLEATEVTALRKVFRPDAERLELLLDMELVDRWQLGRPET